jgi:hypothetical protein
MEGTSVNIETQEIRGINIKVILFIVGAVISSTISIIMTINSLRNDIYKIQNTQEKATEINDLKLRTLDIRVTNMEMEQKSQNDRIQKNEDNINHKN